MASPIEMFYAQSTKETAEMFHAATGEYTDEQSESQALTFWKIVDAIRTEGTNSRGFNLLREGMSWCHIGCFINLSLLFEAINYQAKSMGGIDVPDYSIATYKSGVSTQVPLPIVFHGNSVTPISDLLNAVKMAPFNRDITAVTPVLYVQHVEYEMIICGSAPNTGNGFTHVHAYGTFPEGHNLEQKLGLQEFKKPA